MVKKWLSLALLVVGVAMAAPWLAGMKAQSELERWRASVSSPQAELTWALYERGWMASEAVLHIQTDQQHDPATMPNEPAVVSLSLRHGPWLEGNLAWFSAHLSLKQAPLLLSDWQILSTAPIFWQAAAVLSLNGNWHFQDEMGASLLRRNSEAFSLSGATGEGTLTRNGALHYVTELPEASLVDDDAIVMLEATTVEVRTQMATVVEHWLARPGELKVEVEGVSAKGDGIADFEMQQLNLHLINQIDSNKALSDADLVVKFSQMALTDNTITDFVLDAGSKHISLDFVREYQAAMASLSDPTQAAMGLDVLGLISTHLVPAGPQLSINTLAFESNKGSLVASAEAFVPALEKGERINPFTLFQALRMDAELLADEALVEAMVTQSLRETVLELEASGQLAEQNLTVEQALDGAVTSQMQALEAQGYLIKVNGRYTAKFEFKDGVARLNDKPMPLPL